MFSVTVPMTCVAALSWLWSV